jgi:aerobic-type carbon monoxide dehydrogenase small subunit (CoxS/CutS family)
MSVTDTGGTTSDPVAEPDTSQEKPALSVTRRNFLIGAGAGAAAAGVVLGGAVVANKALNPETTTTTTTVSGGPVPATMRRVSLDIDNVKYDLIVDNRESLWETMNFQLGLSNSNLGCDRAQCGACAVLVDGKAVNGCTVLSARLGRGQKIGTVAGLPKGPGVAGLHPVQRAFWLDGGFQCGICTRGFIMSTVQLLGANPKPNTAQIAEALSGNICRCGEYAKIFTSVNVAAAELRGEQVSHLATPVLVGVSGTAEAAPTAAGTSKEFQFERPMATIEDFEPFEQSLKKRDGILAVSGSERAVTIKWDPAKLDEAKVRQIVKELNFPVR